MWDGLGGKGEPQIREKRELARQKRSWLMGQAEAAHGVRITTSGSLSFTWSDQFWPKPEHVCSIPGF